MASADEIEDNYRSELQADDDRAALLAQSYRADCNTSEASRHRGVTSLKCLVRRTAVFAAVIATSALGAYVGLRPAGAAEARVEMTNLRNQLLEMFEILSTWKMVTHGDPFEFRCPLPALDKLALLGLEGKAAMGDCCTVYGSLPGLWPYQFPSCDHNSCASCWRASGGEYLSQSAVRSLVGLGYAATLAVSGPNALKQHALAEAVRDSAVPSSSAVKSAAAVHAILPASAPAAVATPQPHPPTLPPVPLVPVGMMVSDLPPTVPPLPTLAPLPTRRLGSAAGLPEDITRHAGLAFKEIIAPVQRGLRMRESNVCPKISDWEQYFLNDDEENVHARVYKSQSARVAVVSFRGTQTGSIQNWEIDSDILMRPVELGAPGPWKPTAPASANVHDGFYVELQRVLPHVKKWVEGYIEGTHGVYGIPADWKLIFTGHSLGAALATLAATLAEVQGWSRKPDAVLAFGSPRLADAALGEWWESRGLCDKFMRIAVYNDVITWMPLMEPYKVADTFAYCLENPASCLKQLADGPKNLHPSNRWAHVCPNNELLVPGAMKGVNKDMEDFSALGGALAHFMGNSLFGYGYGLLHSDIPAYDTYCGTGPQIFPATTCNATEPLDAVVCFGLEHDKVATTVEQCRESCCNDPVCSVWQFMKAGECWRGRSRHCTSLHPLAADVTAGQRVH
eukprot:TRINITY_DN31749_c0_g1_i1.p1 TRINITY_DN31749_c0_g1~~TRINITY_DN31749_c0_g1_i1.p1  ORF type:complete len:704 (+),score=85.98 TRINITY_DN31749_c0_g1_i1:75-2114(+)